jgi:hypothetical protein
MNPSPCLKHVFLVRIASAPIPTRVVLALLMVAVTGGCATMGSSFSPMSINDSGFLARSQSKHDNDMRVTTAVPTAREAQAIFGEDIAAKGIQPVWVKVENHSDGVYYLVTAAVDSNHFSPNEAAFAVERGLAGPIQKELEYHFRTMAFRNPIPPDTAVSGFIFTNLDEGEKLVQIDVIGNHQIKSFTFFVQIPGMRVDYRMVDFDSLYPDDAIVNLSLDQLRAALEKQPCCTTNAEGSTSGDPLNLVIVGHFHDIAAAFARRGWLPAEQTYATAVWKTIKSFIFGSRYRYSPLSPLFAFGRHQDFARQKPRRNIHERNHLRLWYSPMRHEGKPVFVGQVSRDIGVRFTSKAWPPVTHKIDPDVDEARRAVVEDFVFSQTMSQIGLVKGVGPATPSNPRENLTGDPYFTDGYRAVIFLTARPTPPDRIAFLEWEPDTIFRFTGDE